MEVVERAGLAARVVPAREDSFGRPGLTGCFRSRRPRRSRRSGDRGLSERRLAMPSRPGNGLVLGAENAARSEIVLSFFVVSLGTGRAGGGEVSRALGGGIGRGGAAPICRGAAVGKRRYRARLR